MKRKAEAVKKTRRGAQSLVPSLGERAFDPAELSRCERDYNNGDKLALAHAIAVCACADIRLPEWAAVAYLGGYQKFQDYTRQSRGAKGDKFQVQSWDDVLGNPLPKGAHVNALRKRLRYAFYVWAEVESRSRQGEAKGKGMYTAIAEELGLSATTVEEYYTHQREKLRRVDAKTATSLADEAVSALAKSKNARSSAEREKARMTLWLLKGRVATLSGTNA